MTPLVGNRQGLDDRIGSRYAVEGYTAAPSSLAPGAKKAYRLPVKILAPCEVSGLVYEVGSVKNGKVIAALYWEEEGEVKRLGVSAAVEQATAEFFQRVPFEAKALITRASVFWAYLLFESATATCIAAVNSQPWLSANEAEFKAPATIALPSELNNTGAKVPLIYTY